MFFCASGINRCKIRSQSATKETKNYIFSISAIYGIKNAWNFTIGDKMERKTGENFDEKTASDIFEKLKNVEGKIKPKSEDGKLKNISNIMNEAKYAEEKGNLDEAIKLYKQVIFELPDAAKAYDALAKIYQKQGDSQAEKDLLKKAIANCSKNEEFKKRLNEI